jgi:hypothetical protein
LAPRTLKLSLSSLAFGGFGDTEIWCTQRMRHVLSIVSPLILNVWLSLSLLVSHPVQLPLRKISL